MSRNAPTSSDKPKKNKYNARKTTVDGFVFDSNDESERYSELKYLQMAGEIDALELQPVFELQPRFKHGKKIIRPITYKADFRYRIVATGQWVVEDVKAIETEVFKIKRKLLLYIQGIEITIYSTLR